VTAQVLWLKFGPVESTVGIACFFGVYRACLRSGPILGSKTS